MSDLGDEEKTVLAAVAIALAKAGNDKAAAAEIQPARVCTGPSPWALAGRLEALRSPSCTIPRLSW